MQPLAKADEFKNIMRLPLTMESLDSRGLYIYDDGLRFVLWFGRMLSPDIAMTLLGPDAAAELSKVCHWISKASHALCSFPKSFSACFGVWVE